MMSVGLSSSRFLSQKKLQVMAGVLGLVMLGCINPAIAQERLLRTLTVTGQGIERIPTTLTRVQLGVEVQGKTATGGATRGGTSVGGGGGVAAIA